MAVGQRPPDPLRGFKFKVQIDGITKAGFREVSGLDAANDAVDYRDGDNIHGYSVNGGIRYTETGL